MCKKNNSVFLIWNFFQKTTFKEAFLMFIPEETFASEQLFDSQENQRVKTLIGMPEENT